MSRLTLFSEPYSPTGNIASEGVLNQLGRPKLDILAVLIREAVQNSWDARDSSLEAIKFGISSWTLSTVQQQMLREDIFAHPLAGLDFETLLNSANPIQALTIYDRGTNGLGGPTRADQPILNGGPSNFVDFLRNVGQPSSKDFMGGTYGYGKAIFYRASLVRTVLVHTHCQFEGRVESRFIVSALGKPYTENTQRFTGRHWWGRIDGGVIEPILGESADALAVSLGLPVFRPKDLGTTIVILQPDFGGRSALDAMNLMAEYLLWYFWPKMLPNTDGEAQPPIQFEMSLQKEAVHIPQPTEFPPLAGFVQALQRFSKPEAPQTGLGEIYNIESKQYHQHLGKLVLERIPVHERTSRLSGEAAPIQGLSHHVALMRQPQLVVKYLEGPELPSSQIEYAGCS